MRNSTTPTSAVPALLVVLSLAGAACSAATPAAAPGSISVPGAPGSTGAPGSSTGSPTGSPSGSTSATLTDPAATPSYDVSFVMGTCPVTPSPGFDVTCGTVEVPEDRADPGAGTVTLAVARIHATGPNPAPDPIVRLEGGPGFGSLWRLEQLTGSVLTDRRDLIWFDQRGTGYSLPSLDCPERDGAVWAALGASKPFEQEVGPLVDAMASCRARLEADGIDLDQYTSAANAADAADIRRALEVDEWNLQGTSYGSALAQEVLRSHPEGVRSVLLDSVYPVDVHELGPILDGADAGVDALVRGCREAPACDAAHPDLAGRIEAVAAAYDADPLTITIEGPDGTPHAVVLDGGDIMGGLYTSLQDTSLLASLPAALALVEARNAAVIQQLADSAFDPLLAVSDGVFASVECQDRYHGITREEVQAEAAASRWEQVLLFAPYPTCATWGAAPVAGFTTPVSWDGPVLVLAGRYDPITPVEWSERVAESLEGARLVTFDGTSHGVFRSNDCANSLVIAFYEDPEAELDVSCATSVGPPDFA